MKRRTCMIFLWLSLALLGTVITMICSIKLGNEWNKKEVQKQSHITPDNLQIDFEVEVVLTKDFKDSILRQVTSKLKEDGNEITLSPFFDKNLRYKNSKLYRLSDDVYDKLLQFDLYSVLKSKDNENSIKLTFSKDQEIEFITQSKDSNKAYISVESYNKETNKFLIKFVNITTDVSFLNGSKFILDFGRGGIEFSMFSRYFEEIDFKNILIKSEATNYFIVSDIKNRENSSFSGELKALVN